MSPAPIAWARAKIVCPPSFVCRQKAVIRVGQFLTEQRTTTSRRRDSSLHLASVVRERRFPLQQFKVSLLGGAGARPHLLGEIGSVLSFAGRDPQ
jgi:hypothetical protein